MALSLLAVSEHLVGLAGRLLGDNALGIYSVKAWAKFTGAVGYAQMLHRDYLNTPCWYPPIRPATGSCRYWCIGLTSPTGSADGTYSPGCRPRICPPGPAGISHTCPSTDDDGFVSRAIGLHLHEAEISAAGPAGTVVGFRPGALHRGTAMRTPRGARYTTHLGCRPARVKWGHRQSWAGRSHEPGWCRFVARAAPQHLARLGFPPPGHLFWTADTIAGAARATPVWTSLPGRNGPRRCPPAGPAFCWPAR